EAFGSGADPVDPRFEDLTSGIDTLEASSATTPATVTDGSQTETNMRCKTGIENPAHFPPERSTSEECVTELTTDPHVVEGKVQFESTGNGTLEAEGIGSGKVGCTLVSDGSPTARCEIKYRPNGAAPSDALTARYLGDKYHGKSIDGYTF